jgi:hypothetical protein
LSNHTTFAMRENAGLPFSRTPQPTPKLAVLVPTRNEAANIEELLRRISAGLGRGTPPPSHIPADAVQHEPLAPLTWRTKTRTVGG